MNKPQRMLMATLLTVLSVVAGSFRSAEAWQDTAWQDNAPNNTAWQNSLQPAANESGLREQLNDSLLELSDRLGRLITESERLPGQEQRPVKPKTPLDQMQEQIFQSRQNLNNEFESTQTELERLLLEQQRRRELQRVEIISSPEPGPEHTPAEPQSVEKPPTEVPAASDTPPVEPPLDIDGALNELADQKRSEVRSGTAAKLVSGNAINQLSLADNVFAAGDVQTAARIYSKLLTEEQSRSNLHWIKFQLAACYRRAKNYDAAERLLREITNTGADEFPVPQARWWLATIEKRLRQETDLQTIDSVLQNFQQETINGANIDR